MGEYRQFCPIARGSEVLAERWTPIIVRNVLNGSRTYNEIAAGAPGLSRALLTRRLHELHRAGVLEIDPKPDGHGSTYSPTAAGHALRPVLQALADWAENWIEVRPDHAEHADPGIVLHSWCDTFLRRDRLPPQRVVARFDYTQRRRRMRTWLLIDHGEAEVCLFDPGFGDDLVVTIAEPLTFTRWHLGFVDWPTALRSGDIHISGLQRLRRALPTWNGGPAHYSRGRPGAAAR